MDGERVKTVLVEGIDRIVSRSFILGLTSEQRAVLLAVRQTVISDPTTLGKIAANVGPYRAGSEPLTEGECGP